MGFVQSGQTYHVHVDHLGTPKALTDASGQVAWKADYSPFGKANITSQGPTFNLRFPGQYFDAETGLHYNWRRYYDPNTGRYITSDPIGLAGGINTYTYALSNPVIYTDPTGLIVPQLLGGGVGFITGASMTLLNGGSYEDALYNGVQAGVAGFISGGGSLILGFSTSVAVSLTRSYMDCGELSGRDYLNAGASGAFAIAGGVSGKIIGKSFVKPNWHYPKPGFFRKLGEKYLGIPKRRIDLNEQFRTNVSTVSGVTIENIIGGYYARLGEEN